MKSSIILVTLATLALSVAAVPAAANNNRNPQANGFNGSNGRNRGGFNSGNFGKGGQQNNNQGKNGGKQQQGKNNNNNNKNTGAKAATNTAAAAKGAQAQATASVIAGKGAAAGAAGATVAAAGANAAAATAAAATATAVASQNQDPQTSLTLDPRVISKGFANDGQDVPTAGQVASRTSVNNFINDCLNTPNLPLTNGQQIVTGSCNNAPIGVIPSTDHMPSAKFAVPANGDTIPANQAFTINLNVKNIQLGNFVNAKENYFAAPQQVNSQGLIVGHTHVVIELLSSLTQTTPTDPTKFAFFKGVDGAAVNGAVQVPVTAGVPAGPYRLCTINSSANHQPVIVPIAQHGSLDDCVYFTAK
ncbi:hypothetical protein C8J56DRAFT_291735 [Mycena floridula]|nr:hypothetical protein C8J56DRAFT_291735 [Mycena floridula]